MRILIITQYFWPENFRINDLARGLVEKGHEVVVLTGIPNYPQGDFHNGYGYFKNLRQEYHGVKIFRVPLVPRGNGGKLRLILNYLSFAFCASLCGPFLCRGKFEAIFVFQTSPVTVGIPAVVLKKLKSAPLLFWILDLWPESLEAVGFHKSSWGVMLMDILVRWIYRSCDKILVSSKGFAASIQARGVSKKQISYFPNWVEPVYREISLKEKTGKNFENLPRGFRVLFAGNIGEPQDFGTIVAAAERLKPYHDIHWIIAGDGRMAAQVKIAVSSRGLAAHFHFIGKYPSEKMPELFSLADVMLVTLKKGSSLSTFVPGKIQSYLACGKPIVAALEGEAAHLIREAGAGIVCPPGDSALLAGEVLKMYQMSSEERLRMGSRGREYSDKNFDRSMLFQKLDCWIRESDGSFSGDDLKG
jgi:colanic acid biosynthesis glycosyl transferase WcaI